MEETQQPKMEQRPPTEQPQQPTVEKRPPMEPSQKPPVAQRVTQNEEVHGMQMLNISKDHKYSLNEAGLKELLQRDDVKDLPVVVVTVAGAYRMGKSFLLDYFLRYLQAPIEKQQNGEWLGDPDAPLTGFSWRGGSERHTTGMVMWPQPVIANLPSGEKAMVILFDTQGTFDSESTVRDNSTVFALSTLLSSVLIYNLKENIKEDDLQHLQLFTKYGELVKTKNDKAFQMLEFLVRDYPFPYEHKFGQTGGQDLLDLRLQVVTDMAEEKRTLREHIRSSFETVTAFLLPHPGFAVTRRGYQGNHGALDDEFKDNLKQLAASLFAPENLRLKKIGGQTVKAGELITYIKTYVDIFDSDVLPKPMDIVKATTEAGLLLAMREAGEMYEAQMEKECGMNEPSLPVQQVYRFHKDAMKSALETFIAKKKLGTEKDIEPYLAKLHQELENKLKNYLTLNQSKVQKAVVDANKEYKKVIQTTTNGNPLCLHPIDVEDLHNEAATAARRLFDSRRKQIPQMRDEERTRFLQDIEERLNDLKQDNTRSNKLFMSESLLNYNSVVDSLLTKNPPLSDDSFESRHEDEKMKAIANFTGHRNKDSDQPNDSFKSALIEKIEAHFLSLKNINRSKHRKAMHAAIVYYSTTMDIFWDPDEECLHPSDLKKKHKEVKAQAMKLFQDDSGGAEDIESMTLSQNMELRYREIKELNDNANEMAITIAYRKYKSMMDENCSPNASWLLIVPIIIHYAKKWGYHEEARKAAMDVFFSRRKDTYNSDYDRFKEKLVEKLDDAYKITALKTRLVIVPGNENRACVNFNITRNYAKGKDKGRDKKNKGKVEINPALLSELVPVDKLKERCSNAIEKMKEDFAKNLSLRSTTGSIETLPVKFEGKEYELQELAQIVRKNPKTIVINFSSFPQVIPDALKAIQSSGLNLNPQQDGTTLFVPVPKVTKEHREALAKNAKAMYIKCRDAIKEVQNDYIKKVKRQTGVSEDTIFSVIQQINMMGEQFQNEAKGIFETKHNDLVGK
ncbi:hypothetical protein K1T71_008096 [Dendrolimus kikuchii]|uniref:Uncharacterized protein n=1 Tax=Dendrolimus kikuchii TaxID=765133 RepID=A0ACC1CWD5_9NEOP|nr:hypothetical protein K1T71_008096 [Dendrolimus kikuchii]